MAIVFKDIVTIKELLAMNLSIPNYQRPYKWTVKNINQLFQDMFSALENELTEYRIGTIVIHEHKDGRNDIVDGQQRTISLHIIREVLDDVASIGILKNNSQIGKNYREVIRLYESLSSRQKRDFKEYFAKNCKVIMIKIDNEMETFQFFDSQNARGKALEVHDLLKAYHLREMNRDSEEMKLGLIERWEGQKTSELAILFERYLYRVKTWSEGRAVHHLTNAGLDMFKGIPMNEKFNYVQYHKAAYLFIEKFNRENTQELLAIDELLPFQMDQPVLAGRRFFEWTLHYMNLKKKVEAIALELLPKSVYPTKGNENRGTRYIRELLQLLLMYYYDRFGIEQRNKLVENLFFTYCYQLRLRNHAVYETSINKYALGNNKNLNSQLNLFTAIKEAKSPNDLEMITLDDFPFNEVTSKYREEKFADLREKVGVIHHE